MANWSQLPPELLGEISHRLGSQTHFLRFRSVCSWWRSSVLPRHRNLPSRFPFLPNDGISDTTWGFHLSKRTIYLLAPPPISDPGEPWLVKVEDCVPGRSLRLLNPLSRFQIKPLPDLFPKVLDLSRFRVHELGQEYVLHYMHSRPLRNSLSNPSNLYMEKVVFKFLDSDTEDYILLTIHVSGKLAVYRFGDKTWTIIHDMPAPYDDVILFRGDFYAVDSTGRAVIVDPSANVGMVSGPVFGGDKKFLVESMGEILMVDMYLNTASSAEEEDGFEQFDEFMVERTVRFKVYSLNRRENKWAEMNSLGDRVLFVGDDCTFSASDLDLGRCKNCIFFTDNFFCNGGEADGAFRGRDISVYDMENGIIAPLADYPEFSKLFWPPPDWIASRSSGVSSFVNL